MLNTLTILSPAEIEVIHDGSLQILNRIGVHIPDAECLAALSEAGADVDGVKQMARLPTRLVEETLKQAGKRYTLHGRDPKRVARFGAGDFVLLSSPGQFGWIDVDGGPRREPTSAETRAAIRIGDALEHIDIVGGMGMPLDVPVAYRDVFMAAELIKGTGKVTQVWIANGTTLSYILEMYEAVQGGVEAHRQRPMLHGFIEPVSPLRFPLTGLEILKKCARKGLPLCFAPMVQAGASGPVTLAGTLVVENAEILAGIVLAQLFGPGVPVCYGGIPHIFDMRTTQISFGAPEQALMAVAMTQVARRYGLPVYINVGLSDSKRLDAQSGLERGMTLLMGALAAADTFGHLGIIGLDQGASLEQLIVDNEMAGYVKRLLRGFEVNDETLALTVIEQVGIGGSFLMEPHTRQHFRREFWFSRLFDRRLWETWEADGGKTLADRAQERKREILAKHQPDPIEEELGRELDRIVAAAARELTKGDNTP